MDQAIAAVIALLGVAGQWVVSAHAAARRAGVVDERLRSHSARLDKHGKELDVLRGDAAEDRSRIVALETRVEQRHGARG